MAWWEDRRTLARFVSDLLHGELVRGRRSDAEVPPLPWDGDLRLDADAGADSLERFALATALSEAIQLHRSGIEDALLARRTLAGWVDVALAGLEHHDAELTFRTSGSCGDPRAHPHPLVALEEEADFLAGILGNPRRIVRLVPCHHIYGFLFTILLPRRLARDEADVIDARAASPAGVASALRPGDLVVGHPASWKALARAKAPIPEDVTGVSSTAPCPREVAEAVRSLGIARFVEVYGASETAGIGWRETPSAPFELMPSWRRSADGIVRPVTGGTGKAMALPDHVIWHDDRRFEVGSRKDDAVQVGGHNVYPGAVQRVLAAHPEVRHAAVRLMRPEEGERLKAFVVPARSMDDLGALERSLRRWIDERLAPPERPKALRFGESLPVNALGKPTDWPVDAARAEG